MSDMSVGVVGGCGVGTDVGCTVGCKIAVGCSLVGAALVGLFVDASECIRVGSFVGSDLGSSVGERVGTLLRKDVCHFKRKSPA